jgi:hypothetical protein
MNLCININTNITFKQMTNTYSEILVAARGWSYPSWHGSFYPDDLPEDWRLSYYSNEFRAVVVPASEWVELDCAELERWAEDVPEEFLFYLEVEDLLTDWEQTAETIKPLAHQLGGLLLRSVEVDVDLSMISANIAAASKLMPVSLMLPDGVQPSEAGKKLLKEVGVQCGWNVGEGKPDWMDSDPRLAVVRVAGNKNFTARQWRETIETSMQQGVTQGVIKGDASGGAKKCTMLMMIDSDTPKINDLRTAMMIGEMMAAPTSLLQK